MSDLTIICPNCKSEIKLTESLAAPLIESTRRHYELKLARQDSDIEKREQAIRDREKRVADAKRTLEQQIADGVEAQLKEDRARILAEATKKAQRAAADDLEQKTRELADLQATLEKNKQKLTEAQRAQVELLKKQRELDDAKREFDLTVEKRVQESLTATREQARKEAEAALNLKVAEKDQTIASMQKHIEELKRRAEQGSQQLQGEVQELALEDLLGSRFPLDSIEPVAKGDFGGDVLQRVHGPGGQAGGSILWESKRTKNWNDAWLSKLRDDQRSAKAEIAVIVSQTLPKGVETFDIVDGIWVTHPRAALPVATVLRESLLEIARARHASAGQQTKTEMVYQYLTGPNFRHRVEAIVEAFTTMQADLDKEKKAIMKQWAKREAQIDRVVGATVGMYGDLQGIAGARLQEIEGLELKALEVDDPD